MRKPVSDRSIDNEIHPLANSHSESQLLTE